MFYVKVTEKIQYTHFIPNIFLNHVIYDIIHILVFSLRGRVGRNQSPVMWWVWFWHNVSWACFWGLFATVSSAFRHSPFHRQLLVRSIYDITWKKFCTARHITYDIMGHAYHILHTYSYEYRFRIRNTYCFSIATMVAWKRLIVTCTLPCFVCIEPSSSTVS